MTVAVAASCCYDDSSSAASEHELENEKDGGDISENDQNKKWRANKLVATAGHARQPQGKRQVANAKLISQSSKEALDIMGLNNQQSVNAQSFLDNLTSAMNRTTDMMAFALAMQTLPDGELKNMVAKQMLAGTGILTHLGDRCHMPADNRHDMPGGNDLNTFGCLVAIILTWLVAITMLCPVMAIIMICLVANILLCLVIEINLLLQEVIIVMAMLAINLIAQEVIILIVLVEIQRSRMIILVQKVWLDHHCQ